MENKFLQVAIDPGANGGIAWQNLDGHVQAIKMPDTVFELKELFECLKEFQVRVVLENVGQYRKGNSGPAAAKFARHVGNLEGLLCGMGISQDLPVSPLKWQKVIPSIPKFSKIPVEVQGKERNKILAKRKTLRKNHIKDCMQKMYPDIKVTLALADALGILTWKLNTGFLL